MPLCMLSTLINPLLDLLLAKYQFFQFNISRFDVHQGYNGLIVIEQLTHCYTEAIVRHVNRKKEKSLKIADHLPRLAKRAELPSCFFLFFF